MCTAEEERFCCGCHLKYLLFTLSVLQSPTTYLVSIFHLVSHTCVKKLTPHCRPHLLHFVYRRQQRRQRAATKPATQPLPADAGKVETETEAPAASSAVEATAEAARLGPSPTTVNAHETTTATAAKAAKAASRKSEPAPAPALTELAPTPKERPEEKASQVAFRLPGGSRAKVCVLCA